MADDLNGRDVFDEFPVEGKKAPDAVGGNAAPEAAHAALLWDFRDACPALAKHFFLGEHGARGLRAAEDAIDQLLIGLDAAALQPEQHVRLARHGTDLDLLHASDQARRDA